MKPITDRLLAALYAPTSLSTCALYAAPLAAAMAANHIDTTDRAAALLGQLGIESDRLTRMAENLNYRTPERLDAMFSAVNGSADAAALIQRGPVAIANRVYANRLGNGDEASGDGWRFRGAGGIQCTGRANQAAFGDHAGIPIDQVPNYLRTPRGAMEVTCWFWTEHGLNALADKWNIDGITRKVNGAAMTAALERRQLSELARKALAA